LDAQLSLQKCAPSAGSRVAWNYMLSETSARGEGRRGKEHGCKDRGRDEEAKSTVAKTVALIGSVTSGSPPPRK